MSMFTLSLSDHSQLYTHFISLSFSSDTPEQIQPHTISGFTLRQITKSGGTERAQFLLHRM